MNKPDPKTVQQMKDMNVLSKQRIGWDRKEKYIHHLAELSANGYITHDEWSARHDWVMNAQTEDELNIAIADLPSIYSYKPPVKPPVKKQPWYERPAVALPASGWLSVMAAESAGHGEYVLMVWCFIFAAFMFLNYYRGKTRRKK